MLMRKFIVQGRHFLCVGLHIHGKCRKDMKTILALATFPHSSKNSDQASNAV